MTAYVAMLRGINVGGHAKVTMTELRDSFVAMGFDDARTYINSGNVVFSASGSAAKLQVVVEDELEARFGYGIKVVLRTGSQLADVIEHNPLAGGGRDPAKLHVTFLASPPSSWRVTPLDTEGFLPDEFRMVGRDVFVHCPRGYGTTKINNAFFERRLGVTATTRTLTTVTTLAGMAG